MILSQISQQPFERKEENELKLKKNTPKSKIRIMLLIFFLYSMFGVLCLSGGMDDQQGLVLGCFEVMCEKSVYCIQGLLKSFKHFSLLTIWYFEL